MKMMIIVAVLAAGAGFVAPEPLQAGAIERACMRSDRSEGNRRLCGCIQQVADINLDRRDQRLAAQFFKDPHRAQEVRQSSKRDLEQFWKKYKQFGINAEAYCR